MNDPDELVEITNTLGNRVYITRGERQRQRRFRNWALVIVASPLVVLFIWLFLIQPAAERQQKEQDAQDNVTYCLTQSSDSIAGNWCHDNGYTTKP